ncbi:hypothetical protein R80B4_01622 [Fibrobacteres bacterium R8-0-B4]
MNLFARQVRTLMTAATAAAVVAAGADLENRRDNPHSPFG